MTDLYRAAEWYYCSKHCLRVRTASLLAFLIRSSQYTGAEEEEGGGGGSGYDVDDVALQLTDGRNIGNRRVHCFPRTFIVTLVSIRYRARSRISCARVTIAVEEVSFEFSLRSAEERTPFDKRFNSSNNRVADDRGEETTKGGSLVIGLCGLVSDHGGEGHRRRSP